LRAGLGEVDDGEASVRERGAAVRGRPEPLTVGAARGHVLARAREPGTVYGCSVEGEGGGDATHGGRCKEAGYAAGGTRSAPARNSTAKWNAASANLRYALPGSVCALARRPC